MGWEMWKSHSDSGNARFQSVLARVKVLLGFGNGAAAGTPRGIEAPKARGLDCNQFSRVDVGSGIFVSRVSDSRYFDEVPEYTPFIKPVCSESAEDAEVVERPARGGAAYSDPTELFSNARKRPVYEAIDFNEIVVKKPAPLGSAYGGFPAEEDTTGLVEREDTTGLVERENTVPETAPAAEGFSVPAPEEVEYIASAQGVYDEAIAVAEPVPGVQMMEPFAADVSPFTEAQVLEPFTSDAVPMQESYGEAAEVCDILAELAIAEYSALALYEEVKRVQAEVEDRSEAQDIADTDEIMAELAIAEYSAVALHEAVEKAKEAAAPAEPLMLETDRTHILALPQGEPVVLLGVPSVSVADTVVVQTEPVRMSLPRFHSAEDLEREAAELEDANYGPESYSVPQMAETSEAAETVGAVSVAEYAEPNLVREVIEIVDPSRDVLYAYRPTLANDEDLFLASSRDDDADLPEDGLESYDRKFKIRVRDLDAYAYRFSGNLRQLW